MFRKLTVFICLLSFTPAAFGAQQLAGIAGSPVVSDQRIEQRPLNLTPPQSLPAEKLMVAENLKNSDSLKAEEPKKAKPGLTFGEWADVHFGDYRWAWWAGGAAVLVGLHAFVFAEGD